MHNTRTLSVAVGEERLHTAHLSERVEQVSHELHALVCLHDERGREPVRPRRGPEVGRAESGRRAQRGRLLARVAEMQRARIERAVRHRVPALERLHERRPRRGGQRTTGGGAGGGRRVGGGRPGLQFNCGVSASGKEGSHMGQELSTSGALGGVEHQRSKRVAIVQWMTIWINFHPNKKQPFKYTIMSQ